MGSTGSRALEVKGGVLICSLDYLESTWDKSSAVVVQGTESDAILRSRYSLAIDYDGIEVTGGGFTISELRSASTSNPSDDGNSIEETNGTGIKREIQVVRGDSLAGPSLNLVGNGRSAVKCQTATSAGHSAALCLYASKTVLVGFTGTYGGPEPTVLAQNSFASFMSRSCYYGSTSSVVVKQSTAALVSVDLVKNEAVGQPSIVIAATVIDLEPIVDVAAIEVGSPSSHPISATSVPSSANVSIVRDYRSLGTGSLNIIEVSPNHYGKKRGEEKGTGPVIGEKTGTGPVIDVGPRTIDYGDATHSPSRAWWNGVSRPEAGRRTSAAILP